MTLAQQHISTQARRGECSYHDQPFRLELHMWLVLLVSATVTDSATLTFELISRPRSAV